MSFTRRQMLAAVPIGIASIAESPVCLAQDKPSRGSDAAQELYPSQNPDLVREIVGASHARLDRVRELLEQHPALAKAAWDWVSATGKPRSAPRRTRGSARSRRC